MSRFKKWSKDILLFLSIFFFASIIINVVKQPQIPTGVLPLLETDIVNENKTYKLPQNRAFIVVFWGSWCPICKKDLKNFSEIAKEYDVIGVGVKSGSNSDILDFLKFNGINLRTINDNSGEIAAKFKITTYPTTLIYDAKRKLRFTEVGYITTAGLKARLKLIE